MGTILNLPELRPALMLDFANSRMVDPRITFSRASAATRWNSAGLLETLPVGLPRIDYDPAVGKCLGFLVEGASTNLKTNSRRPDAATGTAVGTATTIAPDGLPIEVIVETATTGEHYVSDHVISNVLAGDVISQSIFVKKTDAASVREVVLRVAAVNDSGQVRFTIRGDTCTTTSVPSGWRAGYSRCANGWWRVWITWTAAIANASAVIRTQIYNDVQGSYTGDPAQGIFLFGRQIEARAFPTSYIPTGASPATRADEFAGLLGTNFSSWYRQDEGTFLFEGAPSSIAPGYGPGLFAVGDATLSFESRNGLYLNVSSGTGVLAASLAVAGAGQIGTNTVTGAFTGGVSKKTAFAYQTDNTVGATDGVLAVVDTVCTIPKGLTGLSLGELSAGWSGGTSRLNGHIRRFAYYPKRLSDIELRKITEV